MQDIHIKLPIWLILFIRSSLCIPLAVIPCGIQDWLSDTTGGFRGQVLVNGELLEPCKMSVKSECLSLSCFVKAALL